MNFRHTCTAVVAASFFTFSALACGPAFLTAPPAHAQAAARLRQAYREQQSRPPVDEVVYRDLADYDRIFGLDEQVDADGHYVDTVERAG